MPVNIYKITRYADRDFILFQADPETVAVFRNKFPVRVDKAKKGFDADYFSFLRGGFREKYYQPILDFFRENYEPPVIHVSVFRADKVLSNQWAPNIWRQKVEDSIAGSFKEKGNTVNRDRSGERYEVLKQRPDFIIENLEIYRGIRFKVNVMKKGEVLLWCQVFVTCLMDGQSASPKDIAFIHGEGSGVGKAIRKVTTAPACEIFELYEQFARNIPVLEDCESIHFPAIPLKAEELGMQTWFWEQDCDAALELSSGVYTNLSQVALEEGCGFYNQPENLAFFLLLPEVGDPVLPINSFEPIIDIVQKFLKRALPSVKIHRKGFYYPLTGEIEEFIQKVENEAATIGGCRLLGLMLIPPENSRYSKDEHLVEVDQQTFKLRKEISRNNFKGGFLCTIDWSKLVDTNDQAAIIHNALTLGLFALNAQPWKIINMPRLQLTTTYFLGLETNSGQDTGAGILFDIEGKILSYGSFTLKEVHDALVFQNSLVKLIDDIVAAGVAGKSEPCHIIIHTESSLSRFSEIIFKHLESRGISCDCVILITDPEISFLQASNKQGTSSPGIALGNEALRLSYVMNTRSICENLGDDWVYPNPQPIGILRKAGNTPMKIISAQIYWLSLAHINSLHRTIDIPITIDYTWSLCDHVSKSGKAIQAIANVNKTLYWL